jgi:hypothetical protein
LGRKKVSSDSKGNNARSVPSMVRGPYRPLDSPFVLRFSKDESREARDSGQDSVTSLVLRNLRNRQPLSETGFVACNPPLSPLTLKGDREKLSIFMLHGWSRGHRGLGRTVTKASTLYSLANSS